MYQRLRRWEGNQWCWERVKNVKWDINLLVNRHEVLQKEGEKKNQPPTNMKTIQFSCFLKLINTGQTTKMGFFSSKTISQTSKKVLLKSCLGCTGIYQLYWYSGVKIAEGVKKKKKKKLMTINNEFDCCKTEGMVREAGPFPKAAGQRACECDTQSNPVLAEVQC